MSETQRRVRTSAAAVHGREVELARAMAIVHAPCHRCGADTILAVDQDGIVLCPVDPTPDRTGTLMLAGRYAAWAIPMAVNITAEEIRSRRRRKLDPVGYYHAHACDEEG